MYERVPDLKRLLRHRSVFLFGPRQTGKSTLLHHLFPGAVFFDLLEADTFRELSARLDYARSDLPLTYWRSRSRIEVDFVIGDQIAIEVKAKPRVTRRDLNGLRALAEDLRLRRKIVVCTEPRRRKDEDVEILPVEHFLEDLWAGQIC
jgi:predicted AAA+ superfamily ATPase